MEHLLFGLEQHEDERQGLCMTAHHATLRVKETHSALKLSLEPLTFAYGEDDGREYFEKILNSPDAYVTYISSSNIYWQKNIFNFRASPVH